MRKTDLSTICLKNLSINSGWLFKQPLMISKEIYVALVDGNATCGYFIGGANFGKIRQS